MNVQRFKTRDEWLEARTHGIGASEVATIIGLNPWETPYQLWRKKKGLDPQTPMNKNMLAGHLLEQAVADYYQIETGRAIDPASAGDWLAIDPQHPHRRVSPDRLFHGGLLECKTTQWNITTDDLPKMWFVQLQYQLGVTGYDFGSVAWLTRGVDFGYQDFHFNAPLYDWLTEEVDKFWYDYVQGDQEPPAIKVSDITLKYQLHTEGKEVEATSEVFDAYAKLKGVKDDIKRLEERKKELEGTLKKHFKDAETLTHNGNKIATWKAPKATKRLNTKAFKEEHPALFDLFTEETQPARRLLIY